MKNIEQSLQSRESAARRSSTGRAERADVSKSRQSYVQLLQMLRHMEDVGDQLEDEKNRRLQEHLQAEHREDHLYRTLNGPGRALEEECGATAAFEAAKNSFKNSIDFQEAGFIIG